jgi:3',5'-cyclic AMP phosphodiesterase CpdA
MSTLKFNQWQNPDGTENYKCRAWVNFNGTGTVAIRASGNVSSITDNGTGDYTVNFTTALPDANYVVSGSDIGSNQSNYYAGLVSNTTAPTTTACRFICVHYTQVPVDQNYIMVVFHR